MNETMDAEQKELYLRACRFTPGSQRWRAGWEWLDGEPHTNADIVRVTGAHRSLVAEARLKLQTICHLEFTDGYDTDGRSKIAQLAEPTLGKSSAELARIVQSATYDGSAVAIRMADGTGYDITFDGKAGPKVRKVRVAKN